MLHCCCFRRDYIYWSDATSDQLFRSNMDGTDVESLANSTHENIGTYACSNL